MSRVIERQRPTMREVAALAGVAIKTVSRVVNDVPTVDPVLAERVRAAMHELGYRPNLTASSLRRSDGRIHTVGLLVDDVSNPYAATVLRAVERFFGELDVMVLAGSTEDDGQREQVLARSLVDRQVDGLIVMPAQSDLGYLAVEQRAGVKVVFIDREPAPLIGDAVVTDNRGGARRAVTHLLATGRRRLVAFLGDRTDLVTAQERFAGFEEACAAVDLGPDAVLVRHGLTTEAQAHAAMLELLDADVTPDAIFTSQNLVTIGAVRALHERGMQHRVAMVGFDEIPLASLLVPGVTVMAQDPEAIARRAAEVLLARLQGDDSPPEVHVFETTLVARGSGELGLISSA